MGLIFAYVSDCFSSCFLWVQWLGCFKLCCSWVLVLPLKCIVYRAWASRRVVSDGPASLKLGDWASLKGEKSKLIFALFL